MSYDPLTERVYKCPTCGNYMYKCGPTVSVWYCKGIPGTPDYGIRIHSYDEWYDTEPVEMVKDYDDPRYTRKQR